MDEVSWQAIPRKRNSCHRIWSYLFSGGNDVREGSSARPTIRSTNGACTMNSTPTETTQLLASRRGTRHHSDTPDKPYGSCSSSSSSKTFIESPEAVQGKLEELQIELDRFPVQSLSTYHHVQQQLLQRDATMSSKDFLTNLKVLMLRSEHWVASNAASRLLRFLDAKLLWFGREALSRPLLPMTTTTTNPATVPSDRSGTSNSSSSSSNSNNRILDHLCSGIFQVLDPCETKQGRKVLVIFPERARAVVGTGTESLLELMKAWWFFTAMVVETEGRRRNQQQRTDFVAVIYHVGSMKGKEPGDQNISSLLDDQNLQQCFWNGLCSLHQLPLSIQEWHYCYDDDSALLKPCFSVLPNTLFRGTLTTGSTGWSRLVQFHQGSPTECQYQLLQCGIPAGDLPLTHDGTIDVSRHQRWVRETVGHTTSTI